MDLFPMVEAFIAFTLQTGMLFPDAEVGKKLNRGGPNNTSGIAAPIRYHIKISDFGQSFIAELYPF